MIQFRRLSSFGMSSKYSRGRKYSEKEHPYRDIYQRDRDRIIHSAAFRRLEYKTQVFVYHEGDYYRTRLTHTLEVAQIARTIGRVLGLNEDLIEAIALAHDLGHTPFGHAIEEVLDELMKDEGGFDHNSQGLRVVDFLEKRYPDFVGLNLTYETKEGIIRHSAANKIRNFVDVSEFFLDKQPTLEAQVVDLADEIAYDNHDLDDGLKSNMIEEKDLDKISLWNMVSKKIKKEYSNINKDIYRYLIIRNLIDMEVTDLIENTLKNIKKTKVSTCKDVKQCEYRLAVFSKEMNGLRKELREFLFKNLYCHFRVLKMSDKAKRFIKAIFDIYCNNPMLLPNELRDKNNIKRSICDYISSMTDMYALEEYNKLFNPFQKV